MGVMISSLVLVLFMQGVLFGINAFWSEQGTGTSLVLAKSNATVAVGERVAGRAELQGKVHVYRVEDVVSQSGAMYYRVSQDETRVELMPAEKLELIVVASVPVFGVWVRTLQDDLGALTLIGLPLLMLLIDAFMRVRQRMFPVIRRKVVTRKEVVHEQEDVRDESAEEVYAYEEVSDDEGVGTVTHGDHRYVTVLKPYTMRRGYGV